LSPLMNKNSWEGPLVKFQKATENELDDRGPDV
jgi:hypothetical protein